MASEPHLVATRSASEFFHGSSRSMSSASTMTSKTNSGTDYVVHFDGTDDPTHPQNWPLIKKTLTAATIGLNCLASTFASAILSPATSQIANHFHLSNEVATLSTATLFLLGYVLGPFAWAPLSEIHGRKVACLLSMFGFLCFGAGSATATNFQTLALCRFFQGVMGACEVAITTAVYADMFSVYYRGYATTVFALTVFSGPMLASPIGGFTVISSSFGDNGWRWCAWWAFFIGLVGFLCTIFLYSESFSPYILRQKAIKIRRETKNFAFHAPAEENDLPFKSIAKELLTKPFVQLVYEPILLCIALYTAFVYALLYTFLDSYNVVFAEGYGWNLGLAGLPFIGLMCGLLIAACAQIIAQTYFSKWTRANNGIMVPEWRMIMCIPGAIAFPIGLFWFGWTGAYPGSISWLVPTFSGLVSGYGLLAIFMCCFQYLVDVYKTNAASAFASATIIRSGLAAGFPLFSTQLFHNLGTNWGNTLLALLACLAIPAPIFFYRRGAWLRSKSRFAVNLDYVGEKPPSQAGSSDQEGVSTAGDDRNARNVVGDASVARDQDEARELQRETTGNDNWLGSVTTRTRDFAME